MRRSTTVLGAWSAALSEMLAELDANEQRGRIDARASTVLAELDADREATKAVRVLARAFQIPVRDVAVVVARRVAMLRERERQVRERIGRGHA